MNLNDNPVQLSIITVTYNSRKTIERTILSVLGQKQPGIEYIVIDADSVDGTQEVVRSFGSDIDLFVSEPDKGISDGFNKGISLAKGKIIGLINSDDCLLPGSAQKIIGYFRDNPDCQVVHGDLLLYSGTQLVKTVTPARRWWYPWRLVLFNHPATFVLRSVYNKCGLFSLDYDIAMDVEIYLRWLSSCIRVEYFPEPLVAMYYGGVSNRRPYEGYREVYRALVEYGYPRFPAWLLYISKCLLHNIGKIHASLLANSNKIGF